MKKTAYQFPAGTYYVGDLCYILRDVWDEVCGFMGEWDDDESGPHRLKDGRTFVMHGTAFGDGCYLDAEGREYDVDSGTIGCIRVKRGQKPVRGGHLIKFSEGFNTESRGGVIHIGPVAIDTDPEDDSDED